jgi:hypothetical protein
MNNNMEEMMGHMMGQMENNMEENMERIAKLIRNPKGKLPKGVYVAQGTQEDKDNVHVEKPSLNKNNPRGFDSNNVSNHGWCPKGIQLPKINMRKFDCQDPITWIF